MEDICFDGQDHTGRGAKLCGNSRGKNLVRGPAQNLGIRRAQTRIQELKDSEKNVPEGGTITITFSGQDKWKYTPRERLLYSGRLDEHEWTPFEGVNGVSFTDQPAGKHVFQVRAMDRNCKLEAE